MKKLLAMLTTITSLSSITPIVLANAPTSVKIQENKIVNNEINYLKTNNLDILNRNKRANDEQYYSALNITENSMPLEVRVNNTAIHQIREIQNNSNLSRRERMTRTLLIIGITFTGVSTTTAGISAILNLARVGNVQWSSVIDNALIAAFPSALLSVFTSERIYNSIMRIINSVNISNINNGLWARFSRGNLLASGLLNQNEQPINNESNNDNESICSFVSAVTHQNSNHDEFKRSIESACDFNYYVAANSWTPRKITEIEGQVTATAVFQQTNSDGNIKANSLYVATTKGLYYFYVDSWTPSKINGINEVITNINLAPSGAAYFAI
jgi:hypothetical protein